MVQYMNHNCMLNIKSITQQKYVIAFNLSQELNEIMHVF